MNKLTHEYQGQYAHQLLCERARTALENIDPSVKVHDQVAGNPMSSAAACLNVIGSLSSFPDPQEIMAFLQSFGMPIERLLLRAIRQAEQ